MLSCKTSMGQYFLNGSFENNKGTVGTGYIFHGKVLDLFISNTYAYGDGYDLISDNAQNGNWYVMLSGDVTTADSISLKLSSPLVAGYCYTISFYEHLGKTWPQDIFDPGRILIGVSDIDTAFGKLIYADTSDVTETWIKRTFHFTAPFNASYITVTNSNKINGEAVSIDNFTIDGFLYPLNLNIGKDTVMCNGTSIVLRATNSNNSKYLWNTGDTTANLIVRDSGNYIITASNAGCISTDTIHVSMHSPPSLHLVNDTSICKGQTINLCASGADSYKWYVLPSLISIGDSSKISIAPPSSSSYRVLGTTVDSGISCSTADTIQVTVKPKPSLPNITGASMVLVNESNFYAITSPYNNPYTWFLTQGIINSGNGTDSVYVTFTNIGTEKISVFQIENNCASDTATKTIEVINQPNGFNNFKISPNPTDGLLNIEFETAESTITIEIFDMIEKSLIKINTNHLGGVFKQTLEMSALSEGIYLIKISTNNDTKTIKVLFRY